MVNEKDINIGIIHNAYTKRGGEDQVAESEYELLKANSFKVHLLKFENPKGKLKQLFTYLISAFNLFSFIKCYSWLKQNHIDVLHVHNWFFTASPSVFWAARYCKVPVVMTMHNYRLICPSGTLVFNRKAYLEGLNTDFSWDAIKKGVYRNSSILTFNLVFTVWLNKKIGTWRLVKYYIILTEHSKTLIESSHLRALTNKLIVKANFVSGIKVNDNISRQDNFLFAGRLSDEKGIFFLLAAFRGSPHKLTIIGDGPLQNDVENYVKDNSNVTYLGFKDKETVNYELHKCSALIFPSIWYETFGLIMIEAFAVSTPVIASYSGSSSIIVKHGYNGLHFESSNVENLKEKLTEWSSFDDNVKEQYRKNAYDSYLQYYTPEKNIEQLIKIYKSAV
jgi:glycosyltransferase involved in cell wall biosynthesis